MADPFPQPGEVFEERYRIHEQIGSGGFARIYHALHRNLARDVALKILKPKPFEDLDPESPELYDAQFVERFRREARNVAQLHDAHTITLYDFGRTDGLFFMVFEYINGDTLQDVARHETPLVPRRLVRILRGVLSSLHEAHAVGILHRDIKPGNIMIYEHVGRTDQVKVLDFGISKALLGGSDLTLQDLTRQDAMVGTPHYISPEQLRGGEVGPESDLYSLGLVAYELLTGERAVDAEGTVDVVNSQISPRPIALPDSCGAPRNLRSTIHRMLAKDPDERFESARAVREALEHWNADYDLDWTPRWLEPPRATFENPEDTDIDQLPVGEVADQQYRTEATAGGIDQPTRPMSRYDRPGEDSPDSDSDVGRNRRLVELSIVAIVAFTIPTLAYLFLSWSLAPGREERTAATTGETAAGMPGGDDAGDGTRPTFVVETEPPGAHIKIEHRAVGKSPVELPRARFSFPASVQAELPDGRRLVRTVDRPGARIVFDFAGIAAAAPAAPPEPPPGPSEAASASPDSGSAETLSIQPNAPGRRD